MGAGKCGDEVSFKSSYGALGEVGAMVAGRLELGRDVMEFKEIK